MDFSCPRCGEDLAANEAAVGNTTDCPTCGHKFTIPPKPQSIASLPKQPSTERLSSQLRVRRLNLRLIGSVIALMVVAVCVGFWFLTKSLNYRTVQTQSETGTVAPTRKPRAPDIDLISATLYGKTVFNLGLDELTDLMGRPSLLKSPEFSNKTSGVQLAYADKGLAFACEHPDIDPRQTCEGVVIFLASTHTNENGGPYAVFRGNLNYGLNGRWKAKDVLQAFAAYKPRDLYDPQLAALKGFAAELDKETRRLRGRSSSPVGSDDHLTSIVITFPDHIVGIEYEDNTKFIERVIVTRKTSR